MKNQLTKIIDDKLKNLPEHKRQWIWFILLWSFGLFCVIALGSFIKLFFLF